MDISETLKGNYAVEHIPRDSVNSRGSLRVLALAAEAYGGSGGIAQSTRDLLGAVAIIPQIEYIDVLPRLARESSFSLPAGIRQHRAFSGRLAYSLKAIALSLIRQPDIVYCGHAFMAPLAHLIVRLTGARLVSHVHGLEVWRPLSAAVRSGIAASDVILCVSRHTAVKVVESVGVTPERCAVIFNTIDERFTPGDREVARLRFGLSSTARVISTVSRLDAAQRHKGHDRVIPLLADLAVDLPDIVYLIAGTGSDRERLVAMAEAHGVAHLVRFLGFVSPEDLPDLYRATDLYVMPSHGEGFGIAFVEAMACGTPALGLDLGGAPDALCNGTLGWAVTEDNFPTALAHLIATPLRDHISLAQKAREMFGRPQLESRLSAALAPILENSFIKKRKGLRR